MEEYAYMCHWRESMFKIRSHASSPANGVDILNFRLLSLRLQVELGGQPNITTSAPVSFFHQS